MLGDDIGGGRSIPGKTMFLRFCAILLCLLATMLHCLKLGASPLKPDIPESVYAPNPPSALYQGPLGAWISARDATLLLIDGLEPEKRGKSGSYSNWWKRTIGSNEYGIYVAREGVMVRLLRKGNQTIRTRKDVLIISGVHHFGVRWWLRFTRFTDRENCALEIKVLSESGIEGRKRGLPNLPKGTLLHTWQCWNAITGESTKIWDEAIQPDGTVLQPIGRGEEWRPAEPKRCWTCDPENIPGEVRFEEDPLIQFLLQRKE